MARRNDDAWSQRHSEKSQRSHGGSRRLLPHLGFFLALSDGVVRTRGLATGLVDNKVCAIDATWSGLRFVRRTADR